MSDEVPNLRGSPLTTLGFIFGPILGALVVLAGIIWQAAKYPDRSEFKATASDVSGIKIDVAVWKAQSEARLGSIESQMSSINLKLDKLGDTRRGNRER